MRSGRRPRRPARGFTYIGLLVLVALIGILLAGAGEVASTAGRREREAQLLWVGHEYRAAIGRFWQQRRAYPQSLEELLGAAPDAPIHVRYLRQLYRDPMTNAADWVLVRAPNGGIMGVASSSTKAPMKTGNFDLPDDAFADAATYAEWVFTFPPRARTAPAAPSTGAAPGAAAQGVSQPWSTTSPGPARPSAR
jgi:type II secretory pathway pseudopilin PulG